jgi:hypothetical protein
MRLSDAEREQIGRAAARLKLPLSGFVRRAALQASAVVEGKVAVRPEDGAGVNPDRGVTAPLEPEKSGVVGLDLEPLAVVEEPWRPHSFVDGECVGCGLDVNDVRGRDLPCREPA